MLNDAMAIYTLSGVSNFCIPTKWHKMERGALGKRTHEDMLSAIFAAAPVPAKGLAERFSSMTQHSQSHLQLNTPDVDVATATNAMANETWGNTTPSTAQVKVKSALMETKECLDV